MATNVGKQTSFIDAIKELTELDYDAVGAYEVAMDNLENPEYKQKFKEFRDDHRRHINELSEFLKRCNESAPTEADNTKDLLVKGKVKLASLFGDDKILVAMLSNEEDTQKAYERMNSRVNESTDDKIADVLARGLQDEKKHGDWLKANTGKK